MTVVVQAALKVTQILRQLNQNVEDMIGHL